MTATHDAASAAPPVPPSPRVLGRRLAGRAALSLALIGWLVFAIAWLLPLHTYAEFGMYDLFAAVSFFARVFLWPMAIGWLVLAVLSLWTRRRGLAVACLLTATAWALPELWMAWPTIIKPPGDTFAVASFNLNKDLKDATWAGQVMRQMNADFVAIQELSPEAAAGLDRDLADLYPYRALFPDKGFDGMGVLSKTPLQVVHPPAADDRRSFDVVTSALGRELVLMDVHLEPPQRTITRRVNRWQVARIGREYAAETRPIMLAGDFNFTAMTANAFKLRSFGFQDAQLTVGGGRHTTWPAPSQHSVVPKVRIDTVYARGPLKAVGSEVGPDIGSDHLPVKTTWRWID